MSKKKKKPKGKSKGVKVSIHIEGAGNIVGDRNKVSVAGPTNVVMGATVAEFTALLAQLREGLLAAKLDEKARKAVENDIEAIQAEAKDANPSLPVVEGKLKKRRVNRHTGDWDRIDACPHCSEALGVGAASFQMTISVKELLDALGGKLSEGAIRRSTGRLRHLSPAALLSLADQAEIRITGDGNVIGSNNQVFVLKGEGLQELARLLRAASETGQALHQLPPPPGDFTGRKAELEALTQAIEQGGVTITGLRGMGGIGKTALALKLADKLRERYPHAQIYLDLKGTSKKPATSAEAMAHVVRAYRPTAKLPDDEAQLGGLYHSVLDGQRALLLMDNAANAAQVAPLAPPASCVLLVTSRQRFVLRGWVAKDLTTLAPEEARALLLCLAPRVGGAADEIARLCGYLPLALCAAGGMLAVREDLAPHRYAEQLRDERAAIGTAGGGRCGDQRRSLLQPQLHEPGGASGARLQAVGGLSGLVRRCSRGGCV